MPLRPHAQPAEAAWQRPQNMPGNVLPEPVDDEKWDEQDRRETPDVMGPQAAASVAINRGPRYRVPRAEASATYERVVRAEARSAADTPRSVWFAETERRPGQQKKSRSVSRTTRPCGW